MTAFVAFASDSHLNLTFGSGSRSYSMDSAGPEKTTHSLAANFLERYRAKSREIQSGPRLSHAPLAHSRATRARCPAPALDWGIGPQARAGRQQHCASLQHFGRFISSPNRSRGFPSCDRCSRPSLRPGFCLERSAASTPCANKLLSKITLKFKTQSACKNPTLNRSASVETLVAELSKECAERHFSDQEGRVARGRGPTALIRSLPTCLRKSSRLFASVTFLTDTRANDVLKIWRTMSARFEAGTRASGRDSAGPFWRTADAEQSNEAVVGFRYRNSLGPRIRIRDHACFDNSSGAAPLADGSIASGMLERITPIRTIETRGDLRAPRVDHPFDRDDLRRVR